MVTARPVYIVHCVRARFAVLGISSLLMCLAPLTAMASEEEFVGPFSSWLDVRRDFGAVGDGSLASVLALNNQFWVQKPGTTADTVWRNETRPRARGGLIGSNINTSNKDASPRGFEFLENVGDHIDPAKSKFGSGPLEERGGVGDATILRHLAPWRSTRPWVPATVPVGCNDLSISEFDES